MLGIMSSDEEDIAEPLFANTDLFDAEIDSEPEDARNGAELQTSVVEEANDESRDGREDELSGGEEDIVEENSEKSKKIREPKKRKAKKSAVQKIHSETQRLIREASVKLPYHQPPSKDIAHFLKRVPINKNGQTKRNGTVAKKSSGEDPIGLQIDESQPHVAGEANNTDLPDKVMVKPQLSTASDMFFLDERPKETPAGMNHLLKRFLEHSKAKSKQQEVIIIEEPETRKVDGIITENEVEQLDTVDHTIETEKKTKFKPKISPGDKLSSLKEQLQANMKIQRAEVRKIHESQRRLDNEEVTDEEEEEEFEDEEDSDFELDEWNTRDENEQERNRVFGEEHDDDINTDNDAAIETSDIGLNEESNSTTNLDTSLDRTKSDHGRKGHVYSDEQTMDLFSSDTNHTTDMGNDPDSKDSGESIKLRLDSIDDAQDASNMAMYTKVKSPSSFKYQEQSSDGSLSHIQAGQEIPKNTDKKRQNTMTNDGLTPFSRIKQLLGVDCSLESAKGKISKPISELTLPIEDSQDLYDDDNEDDNSRSIQNGLNSESSKDFHFGLDEDSQFTQFVDTQGFLLSTSKKRNVTEKENVSKSNMNELLGLCSGTFSDQLKPKLDNANTGNNNMSELLGLCSGKFSAETKPQTSPATFSFKKGSSFHTADDTNKDDMNELLGLCSGQFSGLESSRQENEMKVDQPHDKEDKGEESGIFSALEGTNHKSRSKQGLSAMFDAMANEDNIDDVVALCSGKFPTTQNSSDVNMDEPEDNTNEDGDSSDEEVFSDNEKDEDDDNDSDIDELRKSKKYAIAYGKKNKQIFDKNNFLEEEAELSGSEFSSDEEENCGDDEFEEDSDVEDLPSDEELQRQVNKVHMKSLQDEDQRDLRALKERYLADGDLHSEGGGRSRNFKWQGLSDSQMDIFENKVLWGDEEVVDSELLSQDEIERRKMRHERDQFLQDQIKHGSIESQHEDVDENSQNILNLIKDTSNAAADVKKIIEKKPTPKPQDSKTTKPSLRRGSFLNRSKDQLSRLSSITAAKKTPASTKGFVFQTVSPTTRNKEIAKKLQRSVSLSEPPNAKRQRLERNLSNTPLATGSLFANMI